MKIDPIDRLCQAQEETSQSQRAAVSNSSPSAKSNHTNDIWAKQIVCKIRNIVGKVRCPSCSALISRQF